MASTSYNTDTKLRLKINSIHKDNTDYWSYEGKATRNHAHSYFKYPAMMVPQMQEELIKTILTLVPNTKNLYEPFIGSGTVLTEGMKHGLNIYGQDINPLAILLCRTKSGPFYGQSIADRTQELKSRINSDTSNKIAIKFDGLNKWFRDDVAIELSKIKRAIQKEKYLWCRRFFWVALAETVRQSNNSRTTTYKLHIRLQEDIQDRNLSPIEIFFSTLEKNLKGLLEKKKILQEKGYIYKGIYTKEVDIAFEDSSEECLIKSDPIYDLLITSPPYGDNQTTISYGQYSFLPLQWIDLKDIDETLGEEWLETYNEIDKRSLGGNQHKDNYAKAKKMIDFSDSLKKTIFDLRDESEEKRRKILVFFYDFNRSLDSIIKKLKPNAYMIWTVGNRNVGNRPVPMDKILRELLESKKATFVDSFKRRIPSKRMAIISGKYETMSKEITLILRNKS